MTLMNWSMLKEELLKMVKGLETKPCKEGLNNLDMFSLEERHLKTEILKQSSNIHMVIREKDE